MARPPFDPLETRLSAIDERSKPPSSAVQAIIPMVRRSESLSPKRSRIHSKIKLLLIAAPKASHPS